MARKMDCLLTATRRAPEDGGHGGVQGIVRDVTEHKEADRAMKDNVVLEERNRMAREIHDTLAQGFTGIVLQLEAAEQALEESSADAVGHLQRAKGLARESLQEARRSVWDLLPRALEQGSLD
jgi:signal transduction histidine kinase